jgi:hypothetical protein
LGTFTKRNIKNTKHMAKIELNSALKSIRGTMDNWVYRRNGDGLLIARRPINTKPPTAAQLSVREQFKAAAAYARSVGQDAIQGPRYAAAARSKGMRAFAFALADFLNEPQVLAIDTSAYHGAVGGLIKVRATDDFEVMGVTVVVKDGEGAVIQQGAAVLVDGVWQYATTVGIAVGEELTIQAIATDRPGHTGSLSVAHVVA